MLLNESGEGKSTIALKRKRANEMQQNITSGECTPEVKTMLSNYCVIGSTLFLSVDQFLNLLHHRTSQGWPKGDSLRPVFNNHVFSQWLDAHSRRVCDGRFLVGYCRCAKFDGAVLFAFHFGKV